MLWDTWENWQSQVDRWYTTALKNIDTEELNDYVLKSMRNVTALERGLPENEIVPVLKEHVETMKDKLPVIQYLRNPAIRNRHWLQIEKILKHKFKPDEVVNLKLLEKLNCFSYPTELMEIAGQASSEAALEAMLKKVEDNWKSLEFVVVPYKEAKDVFIIGSTEEVQVILDESVITVNTVASSRFVGPIKSRVDEWFNQLDLFAKTMVKEIRI